MTTPTPSGESWEKEYLKLAHPYVWKPKEFKNVRDELAFISSLLEKAREDAIAEAIGNLPDKRQYPYPDNGSSARPSPRSKRLDFIKKVWYNCLTLARYWQVAKW